MEQNNNITLRTKIVIFIVAAAIILEVVFFDNDQYRPGFWMIEIALWLKSCFKAGGNYAMQMAWSIWERINFRILAVAVRNLFRPIGILLCLPLYFAYGSIEFASDSQIVAMIVMDIALIVILAIMEHHFSEKYKPTKVLPFLETFVSWIYGWAGTLAWDVVQIYRVIGLQQFFDSFWKISVQLAHVVWAPIKSFYQKFSFFTPASFAGFVTILLFYFYGSQIVSTAKGDTMILFVCVLVALSPLVLFYPVTFEMGQKVVKFVQDKKLESDKLFWERQRMVFAEEQSK